MVSAHRSSVLLAAIFALPFMGCAPTPPVESDERTAATQGPIVNGQVDTDNPAAVGIAQGTALYASCTGTIVRVSGDEGWVLTAAHCIPSIGTSIIALGHLDQSPREFPIVEIVTDPLYDPNVQNWNDDFAVIRFAGADDTIPFVPIAKPGEDVLANGDTVTLVGYGEIEGGGHESQRRFIDRPIESLTNDTFQYDQATGGICYGDSGGPAFADLPVGRRVVGVTTAVSDTSCMGWGGSARVSAAYASFIEPLLEKPSFDACAKCFAEGFGTRVCTDLYNACYVVGSDCKSYGDCSDACGADASCVDGCAAAYPAGQAEYQTMVRCPCEPCGARCSDESFCGGPQLGCGFVSDTPSCSTCIDGCCAESKACAADASGCSSCFPNCSANAAASALLTCLEGSSCMTTCGLDLLIPASGSGGAGGGGSTTTSTHASTGATPETTSSTGNGSDAGGSGNGGSASSTSSGSSSKGNVEPGGCTIGSANRDSSNERWLAMSAVAWVVLQWRVQWRLQRRTAPAR